MAAPITTTFDPQERERIIEHVLEELAKGRSLSVICEQDSDVCSYSVWMRWQRSDEDLRQSVAHAREAGATRLLEEIITISDDKTEDAQSRKVRIHARERYAAMIAPQRFGQKVDITSGGERLPQPVQASSDRIDALLSLAAARMALPAPIEGEMIDVTPEPSIEALLD